LFIKYSPLEKEILIELIKKTGFSQKEFSERTGIPQPRISEYMKGKRSPKMSTLNEIATLLGFKIELFFQVNKI
jgi:transcriptional regulator with XRE-family HTH domain